MGQGGGTLYFKIEPCILGNLHSLILFLSDGPIKLAHFFFCFPLLRTCSLQVLIRFPRFPMCSPRVFPITPCFNPICFAQSPPLLTYIGGPKGEALHLTIESSILGSLHRLNFFLQWANCPKKKVGLVRHPQLINMKQNK